MKMDLRELISGLVAASTAMVIAAAGSANAQEAPDAAKVFQAAGPSVASIQAEPGTP